MKTLPELAERIRGFTTGQIRILQEYLRRLVPPSARLRLTAEEFGMLAEAFGSPLLGLRFGGDLQRAVVQHVRAIFPRLGAKLEQASGPDFAELCEQLRTAS